MDLHQIAMTEFVLIQSTWPIEKSRELIERLKPSHVIVHRHDLQDAYYLFTVQEALDLLTNASTAPSVYEAFHLNNITATLALDNEINAEEAPDLCVVLEDGSPIGFFDVRIPPLPIASSKHRRGDLKSMISDLELRSLVAELPEKVNLGEIFSLLVSLSASSFSEMDARLPFALPIGAMIDIVIQPKRGFILEGSGEGSLLVSSEEETLPLQFKLRSLTPGLGQLRVLAFHRGQPLGALTLRVSVVEALTNRLNQSQEQSLMPICIHQPDLSLLILEHTEAGKPTFTFRLTAQDPALELNLKPFGPIPLKTDAFQYFQDFFKDIETLPLTNSREKTIAEQRLAAKGAHLFTSLVPEDLQLLLWSLQKRIQSVQVQSEEPWIPWELCKLCGQEDGHVAEGPFLCEAFTLTRWLPGIPLRPYLRLKNMAVVVPADSALDFAPDELNYLLSLTNGGRRVQRVPAAFLEVREALASGKYDAWHFSGHGGLRGRDPNKSTIYLESRETLTPEDLSGVVSTLGKTKPLIFLNACQIGRSGMSLTDIGGWARQFLRVGASVFIGAYWSVYDKSAFEFARVFYSRLLTGLPVGKAVQEARAAIKPAGDSTWLAYTVFADPLAVLGEEIPFSR